MGSFVSFSLYPPLFTHAPFLSQIHVKKITCCLRVSVLSHLNPIRGHSTNSSKQIPVLFRDQETKDWKGEVIFFYTFQPLFSQVITECLLLSKTGKGAEFPTLKHVVNQRYSSASQLGVVFT